MSLDGCLMLFCLRAHPAISWSLSPVGMTFIILMFWGSFEQITSVNRSTVVITRITEATEPLESKISAVEKKLQVYKAHMDQLEIKQDHAVQYSKRSCLRVFSIPLPSNENETESNYRDIANKMLSEMNVNIPEDGIDRIHRVGREHKRADGVV